MTDDLKLKYLDITDNRLIILNDLDPNFFMSSIKEIYTRFAIFIPKMVLSPLSM